MPQKMNAFSVFYCNEQLLLSKYISEEAIKRKLFDYKVFFFDTKNIFQYKHCFTKTY